MKVDPVINSNSRCACKHETRSVMTIKVVVGIIIWVLSMLALYMMYLVFVDPMFR